MKKIILTISCILMFAGCSQYVPQRPFVIDTKVKKSSDTLWIYSYYDAKGHENYFEDSYSKYQIGDTTK